MIYQSLLKETEDAAVKLVTSLVSAAPDLIQARIVEFDLAAGDGIDPMSKILRRSVQVLRQSFGTSTV